MDSHPTHHRVAYSSPYEETPEAMHNAIDMAQRWAALGLNPGYPCTPEDIDLPRQAPIRVKRG